MPPNCPNEYAMNQNPEFQSDRQQMGVCQLLARLSATTLTIQLTMYMTVGRGEHETGEMLFPISVYIGQQGLLGTSKLQN